MPPRWLILLFWLSFNGWLFFLDLFRARTAVAHPGHHVFKKPSQFIPFDDFTARTWVAQDRGLVLCQGPT